MYMYIYNIYRIYGVYKEKVLNIHFTGVGVAASNSGREFCPGFGRRSCGELSFTVRVPRCCCCTHRGTLMAKGRSPQDLRPKPGQNCLPQLLAATPTPVKCKRPGERGQNDCRQWSPYKPRREMRYIL